MNRIRVGIIGAGRIGRVHAQSIAFGIPEAEIIAISDPFIEMRKEPQEISLFPPYMRIIMPF